MYRLTVLLACTVVSTLLWSCASDDDEEANVWASTDNVYSSASITSSKATVSSDGDVAIIWQEQETEVRDNDAKGTGHKLLIPEQL